MITNSVNTAKSQAALKYLPLVLFYTYIILFLSIVFCLRAVSSIAIACILAIGITESIVRKSAINPRSGLALFTLTSTLLFLLQCLSLFYTNDRSEGWKLIQRSSGLLFIPFGLLLTRNILSTATVRTLLGHFIIILSGGCLYCLVIATIKFFPGARPQVFFYHDLVEPVLHHAIQYSILVFIGLVWLLENRRGKIALLPASMSALTIAFLSVFLILLSSKLIITFFFLYLLLYLLRKKINRTRIVVMILGVAVATVLLVSTQNPVGNRFRSIFAGNILLFTQPSFGPGVYFNGAQFRLLEWRFTYEILNEQKAWLLGLTPGDAQSFLDRKYNETNMYTGVPGTEKRGFLGYHTHNQFLQSLLENGLLGLAIFAWICCTMLIMAQQGKSNELKWIIGLLIVYCFTDAPFQTQYGIIIFTLFPCLVFLSSVRNAPQQSTLERQHPELLNNEKQPN